LFATPATAAHGTTAAARLKQNSARLISTLAEVTGAEPRRANLSLHSQPPPLRRRHASSHHDARYGGGVGCHATPLLPSVDEQLRRRLHSHKRYYASEEEVRSSARKQLPPRADV